MDLIGRKTTLQLIFIPFAVAWGIIGFSNSVTMLYVGTFTAGFAAGNTVKQYTRTKLQTKTSSLSEFVSGVNNLKLGWQYL